MSPIKDKIFSVYEIGIFFVGGRGREYPKSLSSTLKLLVDFVIQLHNVCNFIHYITLYDVKYLVTSIL